MDLVCEKYKQKMPADQARCRHPKEYCKFRSSCMIHFLAKERDGESQVESESDQDESGQDCSGDPASNR